MEENKIKIEQNKFFCNVYGNSFRRSGKGDKLEIKQKRREKGQTSVKRAQERNCDIKPFPRHIRSTFQTVKFFNSLQ